MVLAQLWAVIGVGLSNTWPGVTIYYSQGNNGGWVRTWAYGKYLAGVTSLPGGNTCRRV